MTSSTALATLSHLLVTFEPLSPEPKIDTEYDQTKVPPHNGNDPHPPKTLLFPPLLNKVQNKGTQGVRARYDAELPPIISIVRRPGRPVISVPDQTQRAKRSKKSRFRARLKSSSENEIFERATHCDHIFCGGIRDVEIEIFE